MSHAAAVKEVPVETEVSDVAAPTSALGPPITTSGTVAISDQGNPLYRMLERIISDPSCSVERVNQAFDFYLRVRADDAKRAYDTALAEAQVEFPPIVKNRRVKFKAKHGGTDTDYEHEDLAELVEKCGPILARHGISHKWRLKNAPNEPITVTCILTHHDGHSEETTLNGPRDESGNKNGLQGIASTVTYLERYTFKSAIGQASRHDDDGRGADNGAMEGDEGVSGPIDAKQVETIRNAMKASGTEEKKFCTYLSQIIGVTIATIAELPAARFKQAVALLDAKMAKQRTAS